MSDIKLERTADCRTRIFRNFLSQTLIQSSVKPRPCACTVHTCRMPYIIECNHATVADRTSSSVTTVAAPTTICHSHTLIIIPYCHCVLQMFCTTFARHCKNTRRTARREKSHDPIAVGHLFSGPKCHLRRAHRPTRRDSASHEVCSSIDSVPRWRE